MSGYKGNDFIPKYQKRNPNSRRQQKFAEKRNRNKMSSIPASNQPSNSSVTPQLPARREIVSYPTASFATIVATPQPTVQVDNSTKNKEDNVKSSNGHRKTASLDSGVTAGTVKTSRTDSNFYAPKKSSNLNPNAHSWKSPSVKLDEDFARLYKVVSHAAPEQFRNPAKPTNGPCNIVPTNTTELVEHRQAMAKMASEQMQKNIKSMKDQITARKVHGAIKSILGKDGKIHESGYSPVLCMPTIWADEFGHFDYPQANWPSHAELQFIGDNRKELANRCGRYLPPPRIPYQHEAKFYETPLLPATFFDRVGSRFNHIINSAEIHDANLDTDTDPVFEYAARAYLGGELLDEIEG